MVDSITPATDDNLRSLVAEATGLEDAWPIRREAFTQWVIEAHDHDGGPDWASAGVTLTDNVPAYERAKLRLLNGPHSTLAYVGLGKGYETVAEAIADPELAQLVRDLMIKDMVAAAGNAGGHGPAGLLRRHPEAFPQSGHPPSAGADRLGRIAETADPHSVEYLGGAGERP